MKKPFYKNWLFWAIIIIVGGIIGLTTNDKDTVDQAEPAATEKAQPTVVETTPEPTTIPTEAPTVKPTIQPTTAPTQAISADQVPLSKDEVLAYTANLTGKTFIKEVKVGTDSISVIFFKNFKEYKDANPNSGIKNEDYVNYFATGDQINKLLMQETSRLFKQFPGTATVDMTIPYDGKTYSVDLTKGAVESFYNVDFSTLTSNEIWREKISGPHFNKGDRQKFVEKFVTVK
ncbi:hypothetical protein [Paenibacillus sp. P46E]|uniref:hypothetical protein n=1 Tax=Paenibacillus sp. P46E TaxID=1349436 RepID=UPI00093AF509|nr:hypothetical protein [Paenibacillus sp. P46E]OKP97762.1 hypothetical protein A3849_13735 [Paenibacillus sp. P46E]